MPFEQNNILHDQSLKHKKVVYELVIYKHTTPASKKHASDLPGISFTASQGKLTDISDIEDITVLTNYSSPTDNTGLFDVLLKGTELGFIKKVLKCEVLEKTAAGYSTVTLQMLGSAGGLTPGGNIAFEVTTGTNLAADTTTGVTFVVELDYLLSE